jgi:hypothetical protein
MARVKPHAEVQVTRDELEEIVKWAEYLHCSIYFNASRNGFVINGVLYIEPPFSLADKYRETRERK